MSSSRGIIFDLFGVVFSKGLASALGTLVSTLKRPGPEIKRVYERWEREFDLGRVDEREFWEGINRELNTDADTAALSYIVLSGYRLHQDVLWLAERFRPVATVAACSNYRREWFDKLDSVFHVSPHFDHVFISSEIGALKPDPAMFEHLANRLDMRPRDLLVIDDELENIRGAEQFGANGLRFVDVYHAEVALNDFVAPKSLKYVAYYSGVVLNIDRDMVALQRRDSSAHVANPGMLSVFGGRRYGRESAMDCALRELREETGLRLTPTALTHLVDLALPLNDVEWMRCSYFVASDISLRALRVREGAGVEVFSAQEAADHPEVTKIVRSVLRTLYER
jgi:putative hydrolase of the HAD superfamily